MPFIIRFTLLYLVIVCSATGATRDWLDEILPSGIRKILRQQTPARPPWSNHNRQHHNFKRRTNNVIAGLDAERPIDERNCTHHMLTENPYLSSPVECARTCRAGEPPKTCYYNFVVERYDVYGQACNLCTPNALNRYCAHCQCVPADGVNRMGLTVNRMIPGPSIEVCEGDFVVIDVHNKIKGEAISIHWHGIYQKDFQYYDGVPFVTQCPILDQNTFRYQFRINNAGTHFWHAHTGLQKMDGVFGSFIARRPASHDPSSYLYDYDLSKHVMVINDWFHEEATERYPGRRFNVVGQLPDSVLINGKGHFTDRTTGKTTDTPIAIFTVKRNRRYRFRLVNSFCTVCPGGLTIQGHNLTVIASDGRSVKPVIVDTVNSFAGERYDFVINTDQKPGAYWIHVRGLPPCQNTRAHQVAILQYEGAPTKPTIPEPTYDTTLPTRITLSPLSGVCNPPLNDTICISNLVSTEPVDERILSPEPDVKLFLPLSSTRFEPHEVFKPNTYRQFLSPIPNERMAALIDGISFAFPPSPPLSQPEDIPYKQFCNSRSLPSTCHRNCSCTHLIRIPFGALVELVLIDEFQAPGIMHPFHLHGYTFHVMSMGQPFNATQPNAPAISNDLNKLVSDALKLGRINVNFAMELDKKNEIKRTFTSPPSKDTIPIPNNGYTVLRFVADNPGYWLFHCHFIYHQMVGMDMILQVGENLDLPPVPPNFPKCGNFKPPIMGGQMDSYVPHQDKKKPKFYYK